MKKIKGRLEYIYLFKIKYIKSYTILINIILLRKYPKDTMYRLGSDMVTFMECKNWDHWVAHLRQYSRK